MSRVLVIESSARQRGSVSRLLTAEFISHWKAAHPADRFQVRDLAREPLPHLDELLLGAWTTPCDGHSAAERRALERSNRLTEELRIADVLVLAAPMYNFAIPSSLKSWFDHVLRAGLTFRYAEQGPEGLLQGKRAPSFSPPAAESTPAAVSTTRNPICARCWASSASTTSPSSTRRA